MQGMANVLSKPREDEDEAEVTSPGQGAGPKHRLMLPQPENQCPCEQDDENYHDDGDDGDDGGERDDDHIHHHQHDGDDDEEDEELEGEWSEEELMSDESVGDEEAPDQDTQDTQGMETSDHNNDDDADGTAGDAGQDMRHDMGRDMGRDAGAVVNVSLRAAQMVPLSGWGVVHSLSKIAVSEFLATAMHLFIQRHQPRRSAAGLDLGPLMFEVHDNTTQEHWSAWHLMLAAREYQPLMVVLDLSYYTAGESPLRSQQRDNVDLMLNRLFAFAQRQPDTLVVMAGLSAKTCAVMSAYSSWWVLQLNPHSDSPDLPRDPPSQAQCYAPRYRWAQCLPPALAASGLSGDLVQGFLSTLPPASPGLASIALVTSEKMAAKSPNVANEANEANEANVANVANVANEVDGRGGSFDSVICVVWRHEAELYNLRVQTCPAPGRECLPNCGHCTAGGVLGKSVSFVTLREVAIVHEASGTKHVQQTLDVRETLLKNEEALPLRNVCAALAAISAGPFSAATSSTASPTAGLNRDLDGELDPLEQLLDLDVDLLHHQPLGTAGGADDTDDDLPELDGIEVDDPNSDDASADDHHREEASSDRDSNGDSYGDSNGDSNGDSEGDSDGDSGSDDSEDCDDDDTDDSDDSDALAGGDAEVTPAVSSASPAHDNTSSYCRVQ